MKEFLTKKHNSIKSAFRTTNLRTQLIVMYLVAVFTPLLMISAILVTINARQLMAYQQELTDSSNRMVRSMLYEITNQIYNISEEVTYNNDVQDQLSAEYASQEDYEEAAIKVADVLKYYSQYYASVSSAQIYYDHAMESGQTEICVPDERIRNASWYQQSCTQYSVMWTAINTVDSYGNQYWNLALVRQIPLYNSDAKAILVITVNENYLRTRIEEENYITLLSTVDNVIVYSTNRQDCGEDDMWNFPAEEKYYVSTKQLFYYGNEYLSSVSTLNLVKSDSLIHVITLSPDAKTAISKLVWLIVFIITLALALPALIMTVFTRSIVNQVTSLRHEMYKASREQYDLDNFEGCYELTQTYNDMQTLIERIQDRDARMYKNEIAEQKLLNEQHKMEFKMLASQINPHFLYNTLEMIRMKALAGGDKETATAIRLLGQSMRYVLDNTGTEYTTLAKELKHIETYLQIQKLRFGDRVNYYLTIDEGIDAEEVQMLPLLLQPIVENAVLHGLEEVESGGRIELHVQKEAYNILRIEISDNGCGMDEETLQNMRENLEKGHIHERYGIGLYNINQRLRINYGTGFGVKIDSTPGEGTTVICRLKSNPKL